jgi:hypothetical protein
MRLALRFWKQVEVEYEECILTRRAIASGQRDAMDSVASLFEYFGGRAEGLGTVPGAGDNDEVWFGRHSGYSP